MESVVEIGVLQGVTLSEPGPESVTFEAPTELNRPPLTFTGVTSGLRAALQQLYSRSIAPPVLMAQVLKSDGMPGLAQLHQYLKRLEQYALLQHCLRVEGVALATMRPLSLYYRYQEHKIDKGQAYVLSRFAYLRNDQGRLILECPLGHAEIHCHMPVVLATIHTLTTPCTVKQVAQQTPGLAEESAGILLNFLANAQALVPSGEGQPAPEAEDPILGPWEFHDLLFHTRSRLGRHDKPYGGTFPFTDKLPPLPVIKPAMSQDVIPLYRPDIAHLQHTDIPFTAVLERRASMREHGKTPINVQQLGEFLYRTLRVKRLSPEAGVSFRPHPAGGALHELEVYPLIDRCDGLAAGLYHYNPLTHQLYRISDANPYVRTLLRMAGITATMEQPPQMVLNITARFQRMQHKYQSMTYAVILKNVGALYQTMYLVATAMGLAPCALGGGHSDLFAQAAGLNYMEETSVGEFILGTSGETSA
jgi:SagB-type dehydrogenase family enzyme